MRYFNKNLLSVICFFLLTGCAGAPNQSASEVKIQQTLLLQAKDYDNLIELYRNKLKGNDNSSDRYQLSLYYYEAGDYRSSVYYLLPMSEKDNNEVDILLVKNMIALENYSQAVAITERMITKHPDNAEAYNLKGVASALNGHPELAMKALQAARDLFIADDVVVNNLAMISIIQQRYSEAVSLLLPQYLRGKRSSKMLHNLTFALVKSGDINYAVNIIKVEKLSDSPQELVDSLSQISFGKIESEK